MNALVPLPYAVERRPNYRRVAAGVLVTMAVLAAGFGGLRWLLHPGTHAGVAADHRRDLRLPEGVRLIRVHTMYPDQYIEVAGVTLDLGDGIDVYLRGGRTDLDQPQTHLHLVEMAGIGVSGRSFGVSHNIRIATGERVPTWAYYRGLNLGPAGPLADGGPLAHLLPNGPTTSLADLRDRRNEVLRMLLDLPRHPDTLEYGPPGDGGVTREIWATGTPTAAVGQAKPDAGG